MSLLKEFCLKHSLVLVNQLESDHALHQCDHAFDRWLIGNSNAIDESRWLDAFVNGFPQWPTAPTTLVDYLNLNRSELRCTDGLRNNYSAALWNRGRAVLINWSGQQTLIALNPFRISSICDGLVSVHGCNVSDLQVLLMPPAGLVAVAKALGLKPGDTASDESFPELEAPVVESRSMGQISIPVLTRIADDEELLGDRIVYQSPIHAWIITHQHLSAEKEGKWIQKLGRRIIQVCVDGDLPEEKSPRDQKELRHQRSWSWQLGEESELLENLICSAIDRDASDIHLEPKSQRVRVRFRIHGTLYEQPPLPKSIYRNLLQCLKVRSGINPDASTTSSDGASYLMSCGRRFDLRVATATVDREDEAAVIRILKPWLPSLCELGLQCDQQELLEQTLEQESGLIVVAGPTGAGKTTTLYALLSRLDTAERSVVTIEQPIEKHLPGAKQLEVSSAPLAFPEAVRAVLRMDPDVIMIGEVRDGHTAQAAVQAALTGHLVLTTVHAGSTRGILERFCGSFGIDRSTFTSVLSLGIAQRLVKTACRICKESAKSSGCAKCQFSGFVGRHLRAEMLFNKCEYNVA